MEASPGGAFLPGCGRSNSLWEKSFLKSTTIHSCSFRQHGETLTEQLREVDSQSHQDRSKGEQEGVMESWEEVQQCEQNVAMEEKQHMLPVVLRSTHVCHAMHANTCNK